MCNALLTSQQFLLVDSAYANIIRRIKVVVSTKDNVLSLTLSVPLYANTVMDVLKCWFGELGSATVPKDVNLLFNEQPLLRAYTLHDYEIEDGANLTITYERIVIYVYDNSNPSYKYNIALYPNTLIGNVRYDLSTTTSAIGIGLDKLLYKGDLCLGDDSKSLSYYEVENGDTLVARY
jgi:hypothetical protein